MSFVAALVSLGLALSPAVQKPTPAEVDRLIDDLMAVKGGNAPSHGDYINEGTRARIALTHIGKPAIPKLIGFLASENAATRERAAASLRGLRSPQALPSLRTALDAESEPEIKGALIGAIANCGGKQSFDLLAHFALSEVEEEQKAGVSALGETKDPRAVPILINRLGAKSPIGLIAAHGLAEIGMASFAPLLEALKSSDPRTSLFAALSIVRIKDRAIVPFLRASRNRPDFHKVFGQRLLSCSGPEFAPLALDLLQSKSWEDQVVGASLIRGCTDAKSEEIIARAVLRASQAKFGPEGPADAQDHLTIFEDLILAYLQCPAKPSVNLLRQAVTKLAGRPEVDGRTLSGLIYALDNLACPPDKDLLIKIALEKQADPETNWQSPNIAAAQSCGKLGYAAVFKLAQPWRKGSLGADAFAEAIANTSDPKCLPILKEALVSSDGTVRRFAVIGLGKVKSPEADALLLKLVADPKLGEEAGSQLLQKGHPEGFRYFETSRKEIMVGDPDYRRAFAKMSPKVLERACLHPQPSIRYYAGRALGDMKTLGKLAAEAEEALAIRAIETMTSGEDYLQQAFRRPELWVRTAAYLRIIDLERTRRVF
jgi:HEAT repeat protein